MSLLLFLFFLRGIRFFAWFRGGPATLRSEAPRVATALLSCGAVSHWRFYLLVWFLDMAWVLDEFVWAGLGLDWLNWCTGF
jgi:hypothetical protein